MSTLSAARAARDFVHVAADGRAFVIRRCVSLEELNQCIALQQQAWGYADSEVVPRNIYVLAQALGGHVFGAWDEEGQLAGFAMAIAAHEPAGATEVPHGRHVETTNASSTTRSFARNFSLARNFWMRPVGSSCPPAEDGLQPAGQLSAAQPVAEAQASAELPQPPRPYLHSHMLAVVPRYQNCGLGYALKLAQRQDALSCGIRLMRWTFDPLMAKNAFFNLHRLGATARVYVPDFYGRTGSTLQGGLPSDRLVAELDLTKELLPEGSGRSPRSGEGRFQSFRGSVTERIQLPGEIAQWKAQGEHDRAEAAQAVVREGFTRAFARGLKAVDFVPSSSSGGEYLLEMTAPQGES